MTGERRIVIHQRAEGAVEKVERFADLECRFIERLAFLGETIGRVDVNAAPWSE